MESNKIKDPHNGALQGRHAEFLKKEYGIYDIHALSDDEYEDPYRDLDVSNAFEYNKWDNANRLNSGDQVEPSED